MRRASASTTEAIRSLTSRLTYVPDGSSTGPLPQRVSKQCNRELRKIEQAMHLNVKTPLLVFGGPYSNLRALAALRERADALGIPAAQTICTGDVVAYCAEPQETTAAVREWGCHVVAGNCEEQLAAGAEDCACGFEPG